MIWVEDHYHLLKQVKERYERVHVEESSSLQGYRQRLNITPTETLRAAACELLTCTNVDYLHTPFMKTLAGQERNSRVN